jgi:hypothetical protein
MVVAMLHLFGVLYVGDITPVAPQEGHDPEVVTHSSLQPSVLCRHFCLVLVADECAGNVSTCRLVLCFEGGAMTHCVPVVSQCTLQKHLSHQLPCNPAPSVVHQNAWLQQTECAATMVWLGVVRAINSGQLTVTQLHGQRAVHVWPPS